MGLYLNLVIKERKGRCTEKSVCVGSSSRRFGGGGTFWLWTVSGLGGDFKYPFFPYIFQTLGGKSSLYSSRTANSRLLNFCGPGKFPKNFGDQQRVAGFLYLAK